MEANEVRAVLLLDIYVPVLNDSYDFSIDEKIVVATVVKELCEIICQYERRTEVLDSGTMVLSCPQLNLVLPRDRSLAACGIQNGYRLMLL